MQLSKIERSLKKISSLVDVFKMDGRLSNIEKALLKDYVKKLYDQISEDNIVIDTQPDMQVSEVKSQPAKEIVLPEAAPIMTSKEPKIVEEIKNETVLESQQIIKPKVSLPQEPTVALADHSDFAELFAYDEVTDISGRLSMSKISDINKAIGINERMFTIKELFNGDNSSYDSTIKELNGLSSFEDAKVYLSSKVVDRFSWDSEDKLKKAQNFIKIVRRLFA